jgi:hypothetical protein
MWSTENFLNELEYFHGEPLTNRSQACAYLQNNFRRFAKCPAEMSDKQKPRKEISLRGYRPENTG